MAISLKKGTSINLKKGNSISLKKEDGLKVSALLFGIDWGSMKKKVLFGMINTNQDVDLDSSAAVFSTEGELLELVYYRNLRADKGAIIHSGDDLTGDKNGGDGQDNERLQIYLDNLSPDANQVFVFLNSYSGHDFATIPYANIRLEDLFTKEPMAHYNLAAEAPFAGKKSVLLGRLKRSKQDSWLFEALGEPLEGQHIESTLKEIKSRYFNL